MALSTGAAILLGSLGSAGIGAVANSKSSDAIQGGNAAGIDEIRRQFDAILGLTAPGRQVGNEALNVLGSMFIPGFQGLGNDIPEGTIGQEHQRPFDVTRLDPVNSAGLSDIFRNLPGVQFEVDQAEKSVGNSFAARGGAFGGNAIRALGDRTGNIASSRVGDNLFRLAGFGNPSTAANAAGNAGTNIASLLQGSGIAQAQGIQGTAGSINNSIQGGLNNFLLSQALKGG